jgi:hypothetical protein
VRGNQSATLGIQSNEWGFQSAACLFGLAACKSARTARNFPSATPGRLFASAGGVTAIHGFRTAGLPHRAHASLVKKTAPLDEDENHTRLTSFSDRLLAAAFHIFVQVSVSVAVPEMSPMALNASSTDIEVPLTFAVLGGGDLSVNVSPLP